MQLAVALLLVLPCVAISGENWPAFRGHTGLGYTDEENLPIAWGGPDNKNVLWTAPLPGQGHASPVVWGDRVFVCTAWWPPKGEPQASVIPEQHVTCYSTADGKRLWDTLVPQGPWVRSDFRSGPGGGYAGPTPVTDGILLYCVFGSSVIAALDFDGKIVWSKEIIPFSFDVTIGDSPILFGDTVLMFCPMAEAKDSRVIAYDKSTGEEKWTQPIINMSFAHSSPVLIEVKGKPQLLILGGGMSSSDEALQSLNPTDGHRLWWCKGGGESASVAYGDGIVYFDSGRGSPGTAVDPTGSVDVTKTHIKWTVPNVPEGIGSPIIVKGHVYRLCEPGVLYCWETATGKQVYRERLEGITTTWASPIADAAGRIFFASAGRSFVLEAGPKFNVLSINELPDPNHASAAPAGGRIYLVGTKNLYCIGATAKK